jgi:penicillin amidase
MGKIMRILRRALLIVVAVVVVAVGAIYLLIRASLPQLDGEFTTAKLNAPVTIERDSLGVATITATTRADLAYATGYAHAQDRYFQMDLQRRVAAGELSALLGKDALALDKRFRKHNFRNVARQVIAQATAEQTALIDAYVAGVNDGRESLTVRPFEYLLLRVKPEPWRAEDGVLVAFAMYLELNDSDGVRELERARLHAALPQAVFDILYPRSSEWDAPLDGMEMAAPPSLPAVDAIDLRTQTLPQQENTMPADADYPGSNNWAMAGRRTANGGALLANDMHLSLRLPHIWYRARLIVKSSDSSEARDLSGVTLPGLPVLVAGSNGRIAWGFTNSHGDFDDLVLVETDPSNANRYRVGERWMEFTTRRERIVVRSGETVEVEYRDTQWGPLLDEALNDKPVALAWTAHRPDTTNLRQFDFEAASSVAEALSIANESGIPVQNFVVADAQGNIGWTLIGKLPKRVGYDGQLPQCWGCDVNIGWQGWLDPERYPRIINSAAGQLWTANSRTLGGEQASLVGDESMDRGARTTQIRDALLELERATPQDMLNVQLDNRALFLKRWRNALIALLDEAYLRGHPARDEAKQLALRWTERADVNDAGYRIVRAFRLAVQDDIYRGLIASAQAKHPNATFRPAARFEDTAWRIMTEQPEHLRNAGHENWDAQLLASLDRALAQLQKECDVPARKLASCTWGKRNTLQMAHPLSNALPVLGYWLRMPRDELPGDNDMPRVQGVAFGASQRFAVSPGREAEGYFHMPGGQSGHPLSPFFDAGHAAWINGEATPFLPGLTQHTLTLSPAR